MASVTVPIDYTSKDYNGFRQSMLDHAARTFPQWTGRGAADFGVLLIEAFASMGDILSYYGDRIASEAFITTATQRSSVLDQARLLGYTPHGMIPSTGSVTLSLAADAEGPIVVPKGTSLVTGLQDALDAPLYFETDADITLDGASKSVAVTQGATQGSVSVVLREGMEDEERLRVEVLATASGEIDQEYRPINGPVIEGSVRVFVDDIDAAGQPLVREWRVLSDLIDGDPNDNVYSLSYDDNGGAIILFGDGVNGRVPTAGLRIYAAYRVGDGARGNVVDNQIVDFAAPVVGVSVAGSTAMTGGLDPEATDQIRANAPRAFASQRRAVTLDDYESLALGVAEVSKAKAIAQSLSSVAVFILGANNTAPTQALIDRVRLTLNRYAMTGATVTVLSGSAVPVVVGTSTRPVRVGVVANYTPSPVLLEVRRAVAELLQASATSFGQRVSLGALYRSIMTVPGVDYVELPVFSRASDSQSTAQDILCREWEVPVLGSVNVIAEGGLV